METIINPMWFYLIGMCDSLINTIIFILMVLGFLIFINCLKGEGVPKILWIMFITFLILVTFIPTSATLTKMLIASQVTTDRVYKSVDAIEKVCNDIITKIDKE